MRFGQNFEKFIEIAHSPLFKLLRVDFETPPGHEILLAKLREFARLVKGCDVVVLSDYGKGGLAHITKMIELARRAGMPVLVDPKGEEFARYRGATAITPNRAELRAAAGGWTSEGELTRRAQALRRRCRLQALLVTRSEEGMTLYDASGRFHVPVQAREVYDVSGAGDTVIATLAAGLAAGLDMPAAVRLANKFFRSCMPGQCMGVVMVLLLMCWLFFCEELAFYRNSNFVSRLFRIRAVSKKHQKRQP